MGGVHTAGVVFWEAGGLATPGIESMAETGGTATLAAEVGAAVTAGTASEVIVGGGIALSPGTVQTTVTLSQDFPLVTLVSMVAPSPDWFVGVGGLSLFEGGDWVVQENVTLWVYDAGTDSGPTYTSPNQDTDPADPITLIDWLPIGNGTPVGTMTFTLSTVGVTPASGLASLRVGVPRPNPTAGGSSVRFTLAESDRVRVDLFDVAGRRVIQLAAGAFGAGPHAVSWDGRLADGRVAPAGVYVVRLETSSGVASRRIVRLP